MGSERRGEKGKRDGTSSTWDAVAIKCPFFRRHSRTEIRCEGMMDGSSLAIIFAKNEIKKFYEKTYCEKNCEKCEIYGLLINQKYNDEPVEEPAGRKYDISHRKNTGRGKLPT